MAAFAWIAGVLLTLQAANSYILLTANLEDVQALAKQLVSPPLMGELARVWRRASGQFNRHLAGSRARKRSGDGVANSEAIEKEEDKKDESPDNSQREEMPAESRNHDNEELAALGRNASVYLKSIKRLFEKI